MKTKYITQFILVAYLSSTMSLSSCIQEAFPENGTATIDQVGKSEQAMDAMFNSVVAYINKWQSYGFNFGHDFGYSGYNLVREVACEDLLTYTANYDWFDTFGVCNSLGDDIVVNCIWYYNYKFLNVITNTLNALEEANDDDVKKHYTGICMAYRAMIYMDLARMYEYKKTGIEHLDAEAEKNKIYGLTVPIVTTSTTEEEGRNNPRAPFYAIYQMILNDLSLAEEKLSDYQRPTKNLPSVAVVHGLMARMWLEMGSRFENSPSDLQNLNSNTDLNIASYKDCFAKAAEYARKAISESRAIPLSEKEWFGGTNYTEGFNSVISPSWIWGSILTTHDVHDKFYNFIGNMSPEQTFGINGYKYKVYRMISKKLFDKIPNADWRKTTWVAPEDAHKAPGNKYRTLVTDEAFEDMPAYTGLKFRPKNGEMNDCYTGACADYPLMRVEEMFLIEAEALAHSQGVATGVAALENFINTYRYKDGSYTCNATDIKDFQEKVIEQKRIEFWGEGIIFWDYKRLNLQVVRGYPNTNAIEGYRFNSLKGYCAPWMNIFISIYENVYNKAAILNPDPSQAIDEWTE